MEEKEKKTKEEKRDGSKITLKSFVCCQLRNGDYTVVLLVATGMQRSTALFCTA
jgi:hypothetical protein